MKTLLLVPVLFLFSMRSLHAQVLPDVYNVDSVAHGSESNLVERQKAAFEDIDNEARVYVNKGVDNLNGFIDSLNTLNLSTSDYKAKLDSAFNRFDQDILHAVRKKGDSIGSFATVRVARLEKTMNEKRASLDSLLQQGQNILPESVKARLKLPSIENDGRLKPFDIPSLPGNIPEIPTSIDGPGTTGNLTLPELNVNDPIGSVVESIDGIQEISTEIKGFGEQGTLPDEIDPGSLHAIDGRIEEQALKIKEVEGVQQASSSIAQLSDQLENLPGDVTNGEAIEKEVRQRAKKKFVDHFAGHEHKIESEIASMEKLQRKYHSVTDVRYLPKRRTNPEKGKPFIERLIIGTSFQVDRRDPKWTGLDISPYAGYKFSDRFRASFGGTYRVTFDVKTFEFTGQNSVYGYRAFADYRIFNGWFGHLEIETLKTKIPHHFVQNLNLKDPKKPVWVPMAYIGIFKTYSLGRHLQGHSQILYDFLAVSRNFDFNKVSLRFGFEYKFVRRKRQ